MPKLSGYLTSQLANPAYGGMLSQGVASGMQGISNAIAERKQRQALDSMTTMLTNADPSDPNVIQSVQAVGRQMDQNPLLVRDMILKAQDQKMQTEAAARAKEQHQWSSATAKWNEHLRTEALREDNAIKAGLAVYAKTGDEEKALQSVPPEYQDEVRSRFANKLRYEQAREEHKEYLQEGKPVSEELLKYYETLSPEAEQAVATYREQVKNGVAPRTAASALSKFIDSQQTSQLYKRTSKTPAVKIPTPSDIKAAGQMIQTMEALQKPGWLDDIASLGGASNAYEQNLATAAQHLAYEMKNNPELPWTKDRVEATVSSAFSNGNKEAEETGLSEDLINQAMELNPGMSREEVIKELNK